jgi:chromosome segregation ATPase
MSDKQVKDYLRELDGLNSYLKTLEQQVDGAKAHLARLRAQSEELDAANHAAAAEISKLRGLIDALHKEATSIRTQADFDANQTRAKATEDARKARADWDKYVAERIAAIQRAAGVLQ